MHLVLRPPRGQCGWAYQVVGCVPAYSHIRLHVRSQRTRKPSAPEPPIPSSPHEPHFQPGRRRMGKPSPKLPWADTGGAAWLAFGPCRNSWLRARHRRKYLQFPQPPPNSSLFHRCQDISSLHLPHGAQKNDTPNRPGGCIGSFSLGPIPPWPVLSLCRGRLQPSCFLRCLSAIP